MMQGVIVYSGGWVGTNSVLQVFYGSNAGWTSGVGGMSRWKHCMVVFNNNLFAVCSSTNFLRFVPNLSFSRFTERHGRV
jgi:hypothetical protein